MKCERLIKLAKSWYVHVRDETMAPARMISFMENHVDECSICQSDPDVMDEIAKITEIILPESKIPKALRMQNEAAEKEAEEVEEDKSEQEENEDIYPDEDDDDDLADETDLIVE